MTTILGILYNNPRDKGEIFGLETLHFLHLCLLGRTRGMVVYVFGPAGLRRDEKSVWGFTPSEDGRWQDQLFPLPTVVYPRGVTIVPQDEADGKLARQWLVEQGCYFMNSDPLMELVGDKWATFAALNANREVSASLPQTRLYDEVALGDLLSRYPTVLLKHRHGFESRGMVRISRRDDSRYDCVHNTRVAQRITRQGLDWNEMLDLVRGEAEVPQDYIVQQGIDLARVGGSTFELRVIMNKTAQGWLRSGMVVRLSTTAQIPYLAVGYERNLMPSQVFPEVFGNDAERVLDRVRGLCRLIPNLLEQHSAHGGELAIDFGFDQQGHPWLIECNSKPFNLFIRTGAYGLRRTNMIRILDYARCLSRESQLGMQILPSEQESSRNGTKC